MGLEPRGRGRRDPGVLKSGRGQPKTLSVGPPSVKNRILAVEDSPTQGAKLRGDLEAAGFEVTLVASGEQALASLDVAPVDLVVSDIVMPGIDGYELCSLIKRRDAELPVILLTSLTDPTEIVRGLEAGADNFLRKPYEVEHLVSRLRTILHLRAMRGGGQVSAGLEVMLRNQRFMITAERQQILGLLISSFEDLVVANEQLRAREEALTLTQRQLHEQLAAVERERRRVVGVLAAVPDAMVIVNTEGVITDASERYLTRFTKGDSAPGEPAHLAARLYDATGAEIRWQQWPLFRALHHGEREEVGANFDVFVETSDGSRTPVIASAAPLLDSSGQVTGAIGVLHEIGSLASYDPVTKLPNDALFTDRVEQAQNLSQVAGRSLGVLAVKLHRFAWLRQSLSPAATSGALAGAAARLQGVVATDAVQETAPGASVGYFGDGLFGVVLPSLVDDVDAVRLARLLAERADGHIQTGDVTVPLSVVIGVAVSRGGDDGIGLFAAAVAAAGRAEAPRQVEAADPATDARAAEVLQREAALRAAIENGELELHYQPQMAIDATRTIRCEALVRWRHPVLGLLGPSEFIPLAEDTDLIRPLGWFVLAEACRQAADWRSRLPGGEQLVMSVNVAARQLAQPDAVDRVGDILIETGLPPSALMLEITESGVMVDEVAILGRLHGLKALGVGLAIDDFGTGYSSLLHVRRFPVDALKIDRAFVAGLIDHPADAAIVAATIRLAQALGLYTVAEGVETLDQLQALQLLGCELGQGYYWSTPLPPAELERWWECEGRIERRRAVASDVD